jgi:signal transduction histidine kinase
VLPGLAPAVTLKMRSGVVWTALLGAVAAAATISFAVASDGPDGLQTFLLEWVSVPFLAAGLVAWARRPDSRLGVLMVAGGFASALSGWQLAEDAGPFTVGAVFDILPAALFLHLCLAFPDGRLRSRFERALVASAYAAAIGLQLVKMSLGGIGPSNLLELWARPHTASTVQHVQLLFLGVACLTGVGVLASRRRRFGRPRRRSLALLIDSFALGLVMVAVLFAVGTFDGPGFREIQRITLFVIGFSAIAFLIGLLDARLARSRVGDLILELHSDPAPADLKDALALTLRDPSLDFAYWLPDFGTYVDLEGRSVVLPNDEARTATLIDRKGAHVAALIHDRTLDDEPQLLEAVGAAAGIALENGRLQAELRARLEELRGSRVRVIEAGQRERQRLERDLHDGAQQRLIALSLQLSLLEKRLVDRPDATEPLDNARREIALSLEELRDVARGIHPAVLTGHGLEVALESIAACAPLLVRLNVDVNGRLPEHVEVAAYYVVAESLTNVAKHSGSEDSVVTVRREGDTVIVEVVDSGRGGADTERGSGIRGLADRVEALGGRLRVWSPLEGGTRVEAEIPCV